MTTVLENRKILADGTVIHAPKAAMFALYHDIDLDQMFFEPSAIIDLHNKTSTRLDSDYRQLKTCQDEQFSDIAWDQYWFTPEPWASMDLTTWVMSKCQDDRELERAAEELIKFQEHNMLPVLRHILFLVDHFRKNNIVWGVGRGSSVSSFLLYLTGINRINPLVYNLSIDEFLKAE